jgi:hypothetical protein
MSIIAEEYDMKSTAHGVLVAVVAALLGAGVARAEDNEPVATPYRPSVSSPAALSAPGWLDMEFGALRVRGGDDKRRDSIPYAAKLAFNDAWSVVLGGELQVRRIDLDGATYTGVGDTTFLIKTRIPTADEGTAWGIAAGFKSPTAKDGIGSGKSDLIVTGIVSSDFAESYHLDANLTATRLGAWGEGEGRVQTAWAAAVSKSLDDQWGVFVEPSGTGRRGTAATAQLMLGASYNVSKRVVLDFAVAQGLNNATPDWQLMFGLTALIGQLW